MLVARVSTVSLAPTLHAIKEATQNHYQIKTINAKGGIQEDWNKQSVFFVMPVRADIPYAIKLNGKGNAMIKNFAKNEVRSLGVCAGAYYAAGYVEFDKGGGFFQDSSRYSNITVLAH